MKKILKIFILIIAVFFTINNSFAYDSGYGTQGYATLSSGVLSSICSAMPNPSASSPSLNWQIEFYSGTYSGSHSLIYSNGGAVNHTCISTGGIDSYTLPTVSAGNYFLVIQYGNNHNDTGFQQVYFILSYSGTTWTQTPISETISHTTPANSSTVSAYVNFTGTYNNLNGTYDTVIMLMEDLTHTSNPTIVFVCDTAKTGANIAYNCNYNAIVNTNYHYKAILWASNQSFPSGTLEDTSGWISFTTNDTYSIPQLGGNNCGTFDVGCYVVNGIKYLFYPGDLTSFDKLNELLDTIKNKPPIGYISGIITALGSIDLNATPTLTFAQFTPLNNLIFNPLRTGLSWVLWVAFAFVIFKRFQHLQI